MNKKIVIVIIGCGYWGLNIIRSLKSMGVKNIYCYDVDYLYLKKVQKEYPYIKIIKDYNQIFINNNYYNNIILSTPIKYNFSILKKLIKYNKNIFVEKPVTKNFKELDKIKSLMKLKRNIFMCGYIYLFNDLIIYIKKLIKNKTLGKIKYIELSRKNYGPIRNDTSSLKDLGSHDISICKFLFKNKIKTILNVDTKISNSKIKDKNIAIFNIGTIKCIINSSWLHPIKIREIMIVGSKKILLYDELNLSSPIKLFKYTTNYPQPLKLKKAFTPRNSYSIQREIVPKIKYSSPLKNELNHFIKCIQNQRKPLTDINFAHSIMFDLDRLEKF